MNGLHRGRMIKDTRERFRSRGSKGRSVSFLLALGLLTALMAQSPAAPGSTLKTDERVIFFPQSARWDGDAEVWRVRVHGWVFEPEWDSLWRRFTVSGIAEMLEMDEEFEEKIEEEAEEIFKARAWPFVVDNERGKELAIRFDKRDHVPLEASAANGHFESVVALDAQTAGGAEEAREPWRRFELALPEGDRRHFSGEAQLLCPQGLSVISDVDDTIKISNVLDKEQLLANTFLRDFRAVPGMPDVYRRWQAQGAAFHYVSGSPWQLYTPLSDFMTENGFPKGSFSLRDFRIKDSSFFNLFASAEQFKIPVIEKILQDYPERKFLLIGDSGERDPEVYGEIARRHPEQVVGIMIRNVTELRKDSARMRVAFLNVPEGRWRVFGEAEELKRFAVDPGWFGPKGPPICRQEVR